jgi:hypothetical protein
VHAGTTIPGSGCHGYRLAPDLPRTASVCGHGQISRSLAARPGGTVRANESCCRRAAPASPAIAMARAAYRSTSTASFAHRPDNRTIRSLQSVTCALCPSAAYDWDMPRTNLASRVGFEPTTKGLKVPCSAAELPAQRKPTCWGVGGR